MKTRSLLVVALALCLVLPAMSEAAVAPLPILQIAPHWTTMDNIGYQGYATNSSGSPVADGLHTFVFSIFDDPTSPTPVLWTETQTLSTTSGRFSANLGETVPIPIDVFGTPDGDTLRTLWLQVDIDTEPILPRTLLTAVPSARVSERVLGDIETELMAMRLRSPSGFVPFEIRSTDSGTTTFQVDSFFDVEYRIEWQTHPYEALVGLYGTGTSTQGGVEIKAADSAAEVKLGIEHEDIGARMHTSDDGSGSSLHLWNDPILGDSISIFAGADDAGARLTISNIGSSGQDGVGLIADPGDVEIKLGIDSDDLGITMGASNDGSGSSLRLFDTPGTDSVNIYAGANSSGGHLTVSNIGSSGQDGVSIHVDPTGDPRLHIFDSTGGLDANLNSSGLTFVNPVDPDSGIYNLEKMKLKDLKSGGTVDQIEINPLELTSSNFGAAGDETTIRINGGSRISLEEKPAGETVQTEILALSLVASEPILVSRPPGSSPSSAPSVAMDYDGANRFVISLVPPSGSALDSVRLHGEGLEMHTGTSAYSYDSFGLRFISSGTPTATISPFGDINLAGNAVLATGGTATCGVGGSDPAYKLFVDGDFCATGVTCPSDVRLKTSIQTIENAIDLIGHLRGVSFDWRHEEYPERNLSEKHQIGFIAQEVEAVLPELVKKSSDGYLGVDYAKITPVLVEAVKEQQKQIEQQRSEMSQMQSKLDRLERLVEQLASERNSQHRLEYASKK